MGGRMFAFVKDFFSSKEAFTRVARAAVLAASAGAATNGGALTLEGVNWVAVALAALGGAVAAGEKNPK